MDVDVLLINLRQSSDRLRFQEQQFERLGIQFERLDAVEAGSIGPVIIFVSRQQGTSFAD